MAMDCVNCANEFDHCHGTLVLHADGFVECTQNSCRDVEQLRHSLVIECDIVQGGCMCVEITVAAPLRRAS